MPATIDWQAVHAEALDLLLRYLRIDTSNPPGNEAPAARFLGAALDADGIDCEYVETAPGRELVVARLRGDGSARPLLLANHLDVVPAEAEGWDVPPFEGVVRDGRIYGRGAVDMKGCAVMQLMAVLLLKRLDVPLRRDLVFLAVPDEEAAGEWGMAWVCEHRPDLVDCEFALNEGGSGLTDFADIDAPVFAASVAEKTIAWLRLSAEGPPGHGSLPTEDNAALRLVRALLALAEWEHPLRFTPVTRELVRRLADDGLLPAEDEARLEAALHANPATLAMFVDTLNLTMLEGGIKANVIPSRSEAVLDCRLLPGETVEGWIAQVRARINDPQVHVEPYVNDVAGPEPSTWDTELFAAIHEVVVEAYEGATVVPALATLATDNRFLRRLGIPAYGLIPCLLSVEERAGFHAHNEFLAVENLRTGTELMYEIARRVCAAAP